MAAINGKTLYITTISRKNRGLSTVYALLNSSPHDPLPTVAHGCSGPIASITTKVIQRKWYNKIKQNRLNAQTPEHNVSLLLLCVCSKRPMKLAHQQIYFDILWYMQRYVDLYIVNCFEWQYDSVLLSLVLAATVFKRFNLLWSNIMGCERKKKTGEGTSIRR